MEIMHAVLDKGIYAAMWVINFVLQFVREMAGKYWK